MKILAIDLGDARTGVAICDKFETLASPLTVIHEKDIEKVQQKIIDIIKENSVEMVVVGYPKNMNNTIGVRAEKSENFVKSILEEVDIPVELWDERSTTVSAIGYLNETNTRGKKRKNVVDAVAATIILESYINWRKNNI